ncbi:TrmH family RNA methyltransferase [Bacillus sp. T33-2]|uniref:TrmH family RNA methyltransferase n=1 Tax=Bacillus sp. T33-2 TaxID=2054168 RepID=UPI000C78A6DE|nr:RNA methyltransferase [Bacillus sp. T33-2]PLR98091.1 RNA methyltransferase [Bacillus sp. T33-2]
MKYIQSVNNPQVKQWKKLLGRKERQKAGAFIVEGFHLVEEALSAGTDIIEIIASEKAEMPQSWDYGDTIVTVVTDDIVRLLADTETPQGVFAVCRQPNISDLQGKTFLLVDSVQDPGNLGTMIRTADAAGIDAVIVGTGSVDIYNPKVLRSAQGSHFHLPVVSGDLFRWLERMRQHGIPVYGTALENAREYTEIAPGDSFALLVGNEGNGVRQELLDETTENLFIPIFGKSESLNVAVAAGILLYYLKTAK